MLATPTPKPYEVRNLSCGIKDLICHEAMNLVSSAFPLHHHVIFVKVGQFCLT